jgi:hypothetical protein
MGDDMIKAVDAEYSVYNEITDKSNLPATLDCVEFLRHPKAEQSPAYLAEIKEEIALDLELGLQSQYAMDQKKILKNDIDELTKSNEYHQVSKSMLEKLFHIDELKLRCFPHNLKEAVVQSFKGGWIPLLFAGLTVILTILTIYSGSYGNSLEAAHRPESLFMCIVATLLGMGALVCLVFIFTSAFGGAFGERDFEYDFIDVKLILEDIRTTSVSIPKMAKLKLKEAKDSGLFEDFTIAHPQFIVDHKEFHPMLIQLYLE